MRALGEKAVKAASDAWDDIRRSPTAMAFWDRLQSQPDGGLQVMLNPKDGGGATTSTHKILIGQPVLQNPVNLRRFMIHELANAINMLDGYFTTGGRPLAVDEGTSQLMAIRMQDEIAANCGPELFEHDGLRDGEPGVHNGMRVLYDEWKASGYSPEALHRLGPEAGQIWADNPWQCDNGRVTTTAHMYEGACGK